MKRIFACLALAAASVAAHSPAAADQTPVKVVVAPADEYFGKMKMSILGIRNEIHDLTLKIGFEPAKAESFLSLANLTEDALKDWERKYPSDPWLPKTLFALERMYEKAPWSDEFNARAKRVMTLIHLHFGTTWYGKEATKEIATGKVGRHLATPAPSPPPVVDPQPTT